MLVLNCATVVLIRSRNKIRGRLARSHCNRFDLAFAVGGLRDLLLTLALKSFIIGSTVLEMPGFWPWLAMVLTSKPFLILGAGSVWWSLSAGNDPRIMFGICTVSCIARVIVNESRPSGRLSVLFGD